MSSNSDLGSVLDFLGQVRENNNKRWFDQHRAEYERARQRFAAFVALLIEEFSAFQDMRGVLPEDCIMRIYRDIRFSRDKSPYRTSMAASIGPGGRKSMTYSYYFHVAPGDETMLAGGLYDPSPEQLSRFRSAIDGDAAAFKKVIAAPDFVRYFGTVSGLRLKTAPQGYDRDHPEIELLRLKQVLAMHTWPDEEVRGQGFAEEVVAAARALKPFLDYLNVTSDSS